VGEPVIFWERVVSAGNSWGLIHKALIGIECYVQVIDTINYKYLCALGDYYLVNLSGGKRAIMRTAVWGHSELAISSEGVQRNLNNFLVDAPPANVDESLLKEFLVKAFQTHQISATDAEKEIDLILKVANDFVRFQIDVSHLASINCFKVPSLLECLAITAYTMESNLYKFLNEDLRATNRTPQTLYLWKPFLYLFLSGIKHIKPLPEKTLAYRGLNSGIPNYLNIFSQREAIFWYSIASASILPEMAKSFASKKEKGAQRGIVFEIITSQAYSIDWLSQVPTESECVFIPGSSFKVLKIIEEPSYTLIKMKQLSSAAHFM